MVTLTAAPGYMPVIDNDIIPGTSRERGDIVLGTVQDTVIVPVTTVWRGILQGIDCTITLIIETDYIDDSQVLRLHRS